VFAETDIWMMTKQVLRGVLLVALVGLPFLTLMEVLQGKGRQNVYSSLLKRFLVIFHCSHQSIFYLFSSKDAVI